MRKSRAGIGVRHRLRPRHVGDVEDEQPVMPVADIEAIAHAQRMMAARRDPIVPGIGLAAGLPLARDPPAPDLARTGRIGEIEDHHDVADIAFRRRRQVGVAAVEIVAMHAASGSAPFGDRLRIARARDVVDRDPAAELGRAGLTELLVVDDHDAVGGPHLVGVPALRQIDAREPARMARVGRRRRWWSLRGVHVADKEGGAVDPDLPAARAVEMRHEAGVRSARHETLDGVTSS